ncbi:MAG TPA: M48 family metallopeptidase [Candidatus Omnitrophota bacterium]|nr:M48 family metallopeptidase [Candidatus Omnitrophota bacterium]HPT07268.1 M48 family metallopeptidase [Candidatus Omnitrophota bacterium]
MLSSNGEQSVQERARRYSGIKYRLALFDTVYLLVLLFVFQWLGFSSLLAARANSWSGTSWIALIWYLGVAFGGYCILTFPLSFYGSFILEHSFKLSTQKFNDWLKDQGKSLIISFVILVILMQALFLIVNNFQENWWIYVSIFWILFSVVLTKVAPIIIIPLFFKSRKMDDAVLKTRILTLAGRMGVKLVDVFEIDFSKKTVKANAAFTGMGSTRRVLLADTLRNKYTPEEIEVILAHEFAHYKMWHLLKLIVVNGLATVASFYLVAVTSFGVLEFFGLRRLSDMAALPVIFMYLTILGIFMQPFGNWISRCFERSADRMALSVTQTPDAFVSMMEKLSDQNLSERKPSWFIKMYFYDHPPIDERIAVAKKSK